MYEKMMTMVMSDNVTLKDWVEFRDYFQSLPGLSLAKLRAGVTEEELQDSKKKRQDFAKAAHHVASKLSLEDIAKDTVLVLAYEEIHHPANFS